MARLLMRSVPPPINSPLGGVQTQSSIFTQPIPIVYGTDRVWPNLLDYQDFVAQPISGKSKGSKKGDVTYDYGAAIDLGFCRGPIRGFGSFWSSGTLPVNRTFENYTVGGGSPSYTVTEQPTFIQDLGVTKAVPFSISTSDFGSPLTITEGTQTSPFELVAGSPGPGQYSQSGGTYHFSAADAGAVLTINYSFGPPNTLGASDPISTLNFTQFLGGLGGNVWAYMLSKHPSRALSYSTIARLVNQLLDLGESGLIGAISAEIYGLLPFNNMQDCDPSAVIFDATTNPLFGMGLPTGAWGDMSLYSDFCVAMGLLVSVTLNSQRMAGDYIKELLDGTNSTMIRNGFALQPVPFGDTTAVGNGATFTPPTDPLVDLGFDDFLCEPGDLPIKPSRPDVIDANNSVRVEYQDRGNNYNSTPVEVKDELAIKTYGYRPEAPRQYHFFKSLPPAALSAQMAAARLIAIRNKPWKFSLPDRFEWINPMQLVTVPKAAIYGTQDMTKIPLRITAMSERDNESGWDCEAEDFPWGTAGPTIYARQAPSGGGPNPNVDAGPIGAVAIIEALPRLRGTDPHMELWIGVAGANPATWGGCHIWMSVDGGATYPSPTATLPVNSTVGQLSAALAAAADPDATNTLQAIFTPGSPISSASQAAENAFQNLMAVFRAPSITGDYLYEIISFASAQDAGAAGAPVGPFTEQWKFGIGVAAGQYLRRGVFASLNESHATGCPVLVLDGKIARIPFDPSLIGKPLYFKITGWNVSGAMEQPLTLATPFTYTPTGQPGLYALTYSVVWDNPSNMLAQSGSSIIVNPFSILSSAASPHYLGAGAGGSLAGAITLDGSGAAIDPTKLYYVYVQDPNYAGENATLSLQDVYEADLTPARATTPGWFALGSIQLSSGGSGSGGGDSGPDGGGGGGLGSPGVAD